MYFSNFQCGEQCCNKRRGSSNSTSNIFSDTLCAVPYLPAEKSNGISTPRSKLPITFLGLDFSSSSLFIFHTVHFPLCVKGGYLVLKNVIAGVNE